MEKRFAKVNISAAGGTVAAGGKTYKITLPSAWMVKLGATESDRKMELSFDGEKIIISRCLSMEEFAVNKAAVSSLLSSVELNIYSCLASHADGNEKCYPSQKQIAKECQLSMVTVYRVLYRLQQKGLLKITRQTRTNGGQRQNLYTLLSTSDRKQARQKIPLSILREQVERAKRTVAAIFGTPLSVYIAESEPSPLSQSEPL